MKKAILFSLGLLLTSAVVLSQGWRDGEKQISITIENQQQLDDFFKLKINHEIYGPGFDRIIAFVTPKELSLIQQLNLNYEVEIEDLNAFHKDFWLSEEAYHSYAEIIELADSLETHFPDICKKYVFGYSMGNRECAALKISDNVEQDENEAEVMFDGGIHGDEIGAAENVIRFARDLCLDYGSDPTTTFLVDNREIWLYLMVNPDGREAMSRYNNNGVDLNRDWAYMWDAWGGSPGPCSQIESKNLRECVYSNQFVVHTTYHSGTEFISCPWSYRPDQPSDWDHIIQLAGLYSSVSGYPDLEYGQGYNGMYAINGSTKDSNYGIMGSISWSMEISYDKQPPPSQILMYYNRNYPSMMAMIEYAGYGLEGIVTDAVTGDPVAAVVFVNDFFPAYADPQVGDYHKYVLPGSYDITVFANGYETATATNVEVTANNSTIADFELQPSEGHFGYRFASSQIPDNNYADEGSTIAAIGMPDNVNYSIGKNGWCVIDMQYPITDGSGPDIIVHEGDATPEGFTCYVGETIDGPWISLGNGSGTSNFDIALSGLPEAQFLKIQDDGDGSSNAANAGFDLDAIEALEPVSGIYLAMFEYEIDDSNGNNNGKIDPGESVNLIVTIKNNGDITATNVQGEISSGSTYITIINGSASFGTLAQGESGQGTFTLTASENTPNGEPVEIDLEISSNGGAYNNQFSMEFIVGQIPVLILDLDPNHNSGTAMQTALDQMEIAAEYATAFPEDLNVYSSVFVSLGIYSENHVLTGSEGQQLADFLNQGGNLYMEGGDTWYYDDQTPVHSMFNINATSDGSGDLGTIQGQAGTFTEGMSFGYSGENNWIDHIEPIGSAFAIFNNSSPSYGTGIAYDGVSYRTIGASHEFGGLDDGSSPSTKTELIMEYLEFFGLSASLQANFNSNITEVCEGNSVEFYDNSIGDIVSWEWIFVGGDPATSNEQNPVVLYENQGSYDVSLTVSDGTNSHTFAITGYITVETAPEIPDMPTGLIEICTNEPGSADYEINPVATANSYSWSVEPMEAGEISGTGTTGIFTWNINWEGTALISVKAMNDCGDSEFSENLEVLCGICTGVTETEKLGLEIYPNPANDRIRVRLLDRPETGEIDLVLVNSLGETIYSETGKSLLDNQIFELNVSTFKPGLYILVIFNENKVIKERLFIN
jgi:uncharacterized repeat protein (TIGR01451 family)